MFALFLEFGARTRPKDLWSFLVSETGLKFLIWTQGEVRPGNRASPVNRGLIWRDPEMAYSACRQSPVKKLILLKISSSRV